MAQSRRRELIRKREKRRQRLIALALSAAALITSLIICLIMIGPMTKDEPQEQAQNTLLPYDAGTPFSTGDLTASQLEQIRREGRIRVSDGPRSISIGDPLDKIIEVFPTNYMGEQPENEQILYCAEVFTNQNGKQTVLPPRGLLTASNDSILVTLLAPTTPYPEGTRDNYGFHEHIYCLFTIEPDSMTVSSITLGIDQ